MSPNGSWPSVVGGPLGIYLDPRGGEPSANAEEFLFTYPLQPAIVPEPLVDLALGQGIVAELLVGDGDLAATPADRHVELNFFG